MIMASDSSAGFSVKVNFSEVVKRLDRIRDAKTQKDKALIFQRFVEALKELQENCLKDTNGPGDDTSLFPFLRLMIPKLDAERDAYGIQTKSLGRLYVKALAINENSDDAKKLLLHDGLSGGDYADVVHNVMKRRSPQIGTLKVYDVNRYLDLMGDHFRNNERSKINDEITIMLKEMTAIERQWLTRIILKKMGLGLGHQKMLHIYHPQAFNLYNQFSHLSRVCHAIESGKAADQCTDAQRLELFKPIRPQLCERARIAQVKRMLQQHAYYLETKMDGERMHIHYDGLKFTYFSRTSNEDFTNTFGSSHRNGLYSPTLYEQLRQSEWHGKGKIKNIILDGEMMVWSREEKNFLKKGDRNTARFLKPNDPVVIPCFCVYDILYLNDQTLLDYPYAERISRLSSLLVERAGSFVLCDRERIRDEQHFLELFNKHIDAREEGVVIKRADAKYQAGKRENSGWFKLKPDYEDSLISDFDLIIIGAKYKDFSKTKFDCFYLGVFDRKKGTLDEGAFNAVCTIRNGFRRDDFISICDQLRPFWHPMNAVNPYGIGSTVSIEWNRVRPDVWINPMNSIVLQVKASQVVPTTTYRTSHTLLFPRVLEIRRDKAWYDTCSLEEFQKFCCPSGKITKRAATENDLSSELRLKIGKRKKTSVSLAVPKSLTKADKIDNVCEGKEFCILNAPKTAHTVHDLEAIVLKHGGTIVENPGSKTFLCIASHESLRVKTLIKKGDHDIASANWLLRALGSSRPLIEMPKFNRKDMHYSTPATCQEIRNNFDKFDDSYTEPFQSTGELIEFLNNMDMSNFPRYLRSEVHDFERMLSNEMSPLSMFRLYTAYFYRPDAEIDDDDITLVEFIFRTKCGIALHNRDEIKSCPAQITHIFVNDSCFDRGKFRTIVDGLGIALHETTILHCQWIRECHSKNKIVCDQAFRLSLE